MPKERRQRTRQVNRRSSVGVALQDLSHHGLVETLLDGIPAEISEQEHGAVSRFMQAGS